MAMLRVLSIVAATTAVFGFMFTACNRPEADDDAISQDTKPQPAAAPVSAAEAPRFVCPMGHGVDADGPGKCPRCGMALVSAGVHEATPVKPAGGHTHRAPHGGAVVTVGPYHFELLVRGKTHLVYLLDSELKTLLVDGVSGRIRFTTRGERGAVAITPVGDHLEGTADREIAGSAVVVVQLRIEGRTETGRIVYDPALLEAAGAQESSGAHADHTARHGGIVLMSGDHHFEVVLDRDGHHRIYMSDAYRNPLPPDRFHGSLTVLRDGRTPERLPLQPGANHLTAIGRPVAGEAQARVEIALGGPEPYVIDVPFPNEVP